MLLAAFVFISNTACSQDVKTLKNPIVIDVRTQAEYDQEHIDGAEHIPYDVISKHIEKMVPDKNAEIALYCRSGRRSGIATTTLKEMGYKNVVNYGGMPQAKKLLEESK